MSQISKSDTADIYIRAAANDIDGANTFVLHVDGRALDVAVGEGRRTLVHETQRRKNLSAPPDPYLLWNAHVVTLDLHVTHMDTRVRG